MSDIEKKANEELNDEELGEVAGGKLGISIPSPLAPSLLDVQPATMPSPGVAQTPVVKPGQTPRPLKK